MEYSMSSLLSSLRTSARTSSGCWRRVKVWALDVCWPISKLTNIASRVLCRKAVLLLVLLDGAASLSDYTLGGSEVSASLISWRYMFKETMRGYQHSGDTLGTSGTAVWAVRTFGDRCGGGTLGLSIPVSTPFCAVLEGVGGYT